MMKWVFTILILLAVLFGGLNGKIDAVSSAAISQGSAAIELALTLCGSMCLWCGVMQVAKKAGLVKKIALLLRPVTALLFGGISGSSKANELISMNITANLFGLGNAATPLGIAAMGELAKDAKDGVATDNMIILVVLNAASIQLIPTTVAALRLKFGCETPFDIIPAVLICSAISLGVALSTAMLLNRIHTTGEERHEHEHSKLIHRPSNNNARDGIWASKKG